MSVGIDVVGVMAAYLPVVRVCTAQSRVHINGQDRTITVIFGQAL